MIEDRYASGRIVVGIVEPPEGSRRMKPGCPGQLRLGIEHNPAQIRENPVRNGFMPIKSQRAVMTTPPDSALAQPARALASARQRLF
jgi:hypothetical protein